MKISKKLYEDSEVDRINDLLGQDDPVEIYDFGDNNLYYFDGNGFVVYREKNEDEVDKPKKENRRDKLAKDLLKEIEDNPEERAARVANINKYKENSGIINDLSAENKARINKIRKRRAKERAEEERRAESRKINNNQARFLPELLGFIKKRYGPATEEEDSNRLHRNYTSSNILVKGTRENEHEMIPEVLIYIDYSGSIGPEGAKQARKIKNKLRDYERANKLRIRLKYFDTEIHDSEPASMGGTNGSAVLEDVEKEKLINHAENVIIMTDNGFNSKNSDKPVSVDGMVWLLFKDGYVDRNLVNQLSGKSYPYQRLYAWDYDKGLAGK